MADRPFARKRSGGPRTAAGKALVAGNAISHGVNARMVTLASEDPAEFETLFQGLVADFRPVGTTETLIIHRMAHLVWKQRRLEGYEHDQISQAALVKVQIEEIWKKMNLLKPGDTVYKLFGSLDDFDGPDLAHAKSLLLDCGEFEQLPKIVMDPVQGPKDFPEFWQHVIPYGWRTDPITSTVFGLSTDDPDLEIMAEIKSAVNGTRRHFEAVVFLIENRDNIHHAQAAVRAEKMTLAWNLDRSHRYHTLLEGQFYRALKELRAQQNWRFNSMSEKKNGPELS